jgi:hypothetical protein
MSQGKCEKLLSNYLFFHAYYSLCLPSDHPAPAAPGVRLLDWCSLELPTARYFADFVAKGVRPTVHTVFLGMYRAIVEDDRATLDALRHARVWWWWWFRLSLRMAREWQSGFSHHALFFATTHKNMFRIEYQAIFHFMHRENMWQPPSQLLYFLFDFLFCLTSAICTSASSVSTGRKSCARASHRAAPRTRGPRRSALAWRAVWPSRRRRWRRTRARSAARAMRARSR